MSAAAAAGAGAGAGAGAKSEHTAAPGVDARLRVRSGLAHIGDTPIKQQAAHTSRLKAAGVKLVDMTQGVPGINIPTPAKQAMTALLDSGRLPYMTSVAETGVRNTCADFVNRVYSLEAFGVPKVTAEHVVLTAGAIEAIKCALALKVDGSLRTIGGSDVVLAPRPCYEVYRHQTEVLGGEFQHIETAPSHGFVATAQDLRRAFAAHTLLTPQRENVQPARVRGVKAVILNFPQNPTGSVLTPDAAKELADELHQLLVVYMNTLACVTRRDGGVDTAKGEGFVVILDEVYLGTAFGPHASVLHYMSPLVLSHTLLILSSSKALGAMPGARAAWVTAFGQGSKDAVNAMAHWHLTCSATNVLAAAGLAASLKNILAAELPTSKEMDLRTSMTSSARSRVYPTQSAVALHYRARATFLVSYLTLMLRKTYNLNIPIAGGRTPAAGFYVLCDFSCVKALSSGRIKTDVEFCDFLRDMHTKGQASPRGLISATELLSKTQESDTHDIFDVKRVYSGHTGLVVVPGSAFELPSGDMWIRFNVAKDWDELYVAMSVLDRALNELWVSCQRSHSLIEDPIGAQMWHLQREMATSARAAMNDVLDKCQPRRSSWRMGGEAVAFGTPEVGILLEKLFRTRGAKRAEPTKTEEEFREQCNAEVRKIMLDTKREREAREAAVLCTTIATQCRECMRVTAATCGVACKQKHFCSVACGAVCWTRQRFESAVADYEARHDARPPSMASQGHYTAQFHMWSRPSSLQQHAVRVDVGKDRKCGEVGATVTPGAASTLLCGYPEHMCTTLDANERERAAEAAPTTGASADACVCSTSNGRPDMQDFSIWHRAQQRRAPGAPGKLLKPGYSTRRQDAAAAAVAANATTTAASSVDNKDELDAARKRVDALLQELRDHKAADVLRQELHARFDQNRQCWMLLTPDNAPASAMLGTPSEFGTRPPSNPGWYQRYEAQWQRDQWREEARLLSADPEANKKLEPCDSCGGRGGHAAICHRHRKCVDCDAALRPVCDRCHKHRTDHSVICPFRAAPCDCDADSRDNCA